MACQDVVYYRPRDHDSVVLRVAAMMAIIMWRPSTPRELALKLAQSSSVTNGAVDNIRRRLACLHNFGVVRVIGKRRSGRRTAFVFAMQASPFAVEDDTLTMLDASNNPI